MTAIEELIITGLIGAVIALVAVFSSQGGVEASAERNAALAAFPITERVTAAINLMQSQSEAGYVEVALPKTNCEVIITRRYVEAVVHRLDKVGRYGLYLFEDSGEVFKKVACNPEENAKICVRRGAGTGATVFVTAGACS